MTLFRSMVTIALLPILGLTAGCQPGEVTAPKIAVASPQPSVRLTTVKPVRRALECSVELPGRVEATEVVPLYSRVTGYVSSINVELGDRVRGPQEHEPGQALCELLVPELKEDLAAAEARTAQARAEVLQAEAAVRAAAAGVKTAHALVKEAEAVVQHEAPKLARWESEYRRSVEQYDRGNLKALQLDEARENFEAAQAVLDEASEHFAAAESVEAQAKGELEKSQVAVIAMQARVQVVEAELRRARIMLDYATLRAPFDGIVVERSMQRGQLSRSDGEWMEVPLLRLMRVDAFRVVVDVPEIAALQIKAGAKAEIRVPSQPAIVVPAAVARTSWALDDRSHALRVEIEFPDPHEELRPGQRVQVVLDVARLENALSLPRKTILVQDQQAFCHCVDADGRVSRKLVVLGLQAGENWEIRDGLNGDEDVLSEDPGAFHDGQLVERPGL